MARKLKSDRVLFLAAVLLVCASIVMVYSASATVAQQHNQTQFHYLVRQAMWASLGVALLALAMRFDYRHFKQPAVIWMFLGLTVVGLVLVLFGRAVNGSKRWVGYGSFGVQPSEFAKLAVAMFTAALLEKRMHRINEVAYSLLPIGLVLGAVVGLTLLEPDFGTSVVIAAIAAFMVFAAGLDWRYLAGLAAAGIPLAIGALWLEPYRVQRLLAFIDPWKDPRDTGYQLVQSLTAVGTGGVIGRGIGWGIQKLYYVPEPHNDFIYAVIGEELGLLGTTAILICFAVIVWRGLRIASRVPDTFAALLSVGLTTMIGLQAFINISVVIGLVPTKGIPLPLVSAGGSSMLVSMLAVGILLNMSQHASAEE